MHLFGKKQPPSPVEPPPDDFGVYLARATLSLSQDDLPVAKNNAHRALAFADTKAEHVEALTLLGRVECQTKRAHLGVAYLKLALDLAKEIKDQSLVEAVEREIQANTVL